MMLSGVRYKKHHRGSNENSETKLIVVRSILTGKNKQPEHNDMETQIKTIQSTKQNEID